MVIDHQSENIFFVYNTPDLLRTYKTNDFRKVERPEDLKLFVCIGINFVGKM